MNPTRPPTGSDSLVMVLVLAVFIGLIATISLMHDASYTELTLFREDDLVRIDLFIYPERSKPILSIDSDDKESIGLFIRATKSTTKHDSSREDYNGHELQAVLYLTNNRSENLLLHQGEVCGATVYIDIVEPMGRGLLYKGFAKSESDLYQWLQLQGLTRYLGCEPAIK